TCFEQAMRQRPSEVTFLLLDLHGSILVVIDYPILALGAAHTDQFFDNFGYGVGFRANGARAGTAAERAHTAHDHLGFLTWEARHERLLHRQQGIASHQHGTRFSEIQRDDRYFFRVDVLPHV